MPYRDRSRTRDEKVGESFRPDDRYEALAKMTPERRDAVLQSSPVMRIAYGAYLSGRDAAQRLASLDKEMTA